MYAAELGVKKFSCYSEIFFSYFFLSSPLAWLCLLPMFPSIRSFPFLQAFECFPDLVVVPSAASVFLFSLSVLLIFQCQIPFLYHRCTFFWFVSESSGLFLFFSFLLFFFFSCKYLYIHVHKVINVFLWFCKFVALCELPLSLVEWPHWYDSCGKSESP